MEPKLPPIEEYSKPTKVEQRKLCTLYYLKVRSKPIKPERELFIAYDECHPQVDGFKVRYVYVVRFFEKGNEAGNHYHVKKDEIMIPINGNMSICLEDILTKETETIAISSAKPIAVRVKPKIAHKVVSKKQGDTLLVLSSTPSADEDEFEYKVKG